MFLERSKALVKYSIDETLRSILSNARQEFPETYLATEGETIALEIPVHTAALV
jgi:hypothetical protein